ncbi:MAG: tRNA (adenosine(37)-N6)-dimethylallyltransferase MiaA [Pseudomonadota bacterium]
MDSANRHLIVIAGPTAVGKTDLGLQLAREFPCDLISVDSAMVYRGMDIGTAKPDPATLRDIPHRLIDIRDPDETYSAGEFQRDALRCVENSWAAERLPVLVGGTLLYVRALHGGLAPLPAADADVRRDLDRQAATRGWPALHADLARVDASSAARIAPNDGQRIQRALEVYQLTGKALSALHAAADGPAPNWQTHAFGLVPSERSVLHSRIEQRFDEMLAAGFEDEVRGLIATYGVGSDHPSMRAVGYRQLLHCIAGRSSRSDAIAAAKAATRQLAKRQLTWLRHDSLYRCVDPLSKAVYDPIAKLVNELTA